MSGPDSGIGTSASDPAIPAPQQPHQQIIAPQVVTEAVDTGLNAIDDVKQGLIRNPALLNKIATTVGATSETITPLIHKGLNAIESILKKEGSGPDVSSRIASIVQRIVKPFIGPSTNIQHALLEPVTTYRPATAKIKKAAANEYDNQGGGNVSLPPAAPTLKPMIGKKAKKPKMIATTTPPALDRILSSLSNIETYMSNMKTINDTVTTIDTNLRQILEVSKGANPTPESNVDGNEDNAQEGGRRRRSRKTRVRRQTKGKRKGRGRTRR